ncbi:MAG: threonine/serine exporter family protein, partial [Aeromonas sp.]
MSSITPVFTSTLTSTPISTLTSTLGSPPVLSREQQTDITRIVVKVGQMLAQFGAESRIIEQTTVRLGIALGLESVEMAISSSAIVLTSLYRGGCVTTTRRVR